MPDMILIIDDERSLSQALEIRLRAAGYSVTAAFNGLTGVAAAGALPRPSAILLDIRMQDIDGFEVNRRLKQSRRTADIPVVFLSANIQDSARQQALAEGASAYLTKPCDLRDLLDTLGRVIAEHTAPKELFNATR